MARLFLCGDVMTARGVDRILPHPGSPVLHERHARSAQEYVELAERESGPIGAPRDFPYVWGDANTELDRFSPEARIANLETAVTAHGAPCRGKAVLYRMHPSNIPVLSAARLDCCVLANNHVLDWGRDGLDDTLRALRAAGIRTAGAGADAVQAEAPAILPMPDGGRVLVFACAMESAGVPASWAARASRSGVCFVQQPSPAAALAMADRIRAHRLAGDLVVLSVHWGANWGYEVAPGEREFAHALVDQGAVDVLHGHSSHHPKAIEVYRGRPILYGCGDLLNDYEGIGDFREFRPELALLYLATLEPGAGLRRLELVPMRRRRMRLEHAARDDARWLAAMLAREGLPLGTHAQLGADGRIRVAAA